MFPRKTFPAFLLTAFVPVVLSKPILIYHADSYSGAENLKANLVATGLIGLSEIDTIDERYSPADLPTLSQYDCVISYTDLVPNDSIAMGDLLKDFVDAGGRVTIMTYSYSSPWDLKGAINDLGYNPFEATANRMYNFPRELDFSSADTEHFLLDGVTEFTYGGNSNYYEVILSGSGASLVASDDYGVPLIAINEAKTVTGINLFPGNVFSKSPGVYRTIYNSCTGVHVIEVDVDVQPNEDDEVGCININGRGKIPVAILGSASFDVSEIDQASLEFNGIPVAYRGRVGNRVPHCSTEDINADGYIDLVCKFNRDIGEWEPLSATAGTITGLTNDGVEIHGEDIICVI